MPRLPFTGFYVSSTILTIISAVVWQKYLLMVIFLIIQALSFVWFLVSYIPGGSSGMIMVLKMAGSSIANKFAF